jgi:hypothetical protein
VQRNVHDITTARAFRNVAFSSLVYYSTEPYIIRGHDNGVAQMRVLRALGGRQHQCASVGLHGGGPPIQRDELALCGGHGFVTVLFEVCLRASRACPREARARPRSGSSSHGVVLALSKNDLQERAQPSAADAASAALASAAEALRTYTVLNTTAEATVTAALATAETAVAAAEAATAAAITHAAEMKAAEPKAKRPKVAELFVGLQVVPMLFTCLHCEPT